MSLTARGWLATAVFVTGVCAVPALAAPGAKQPAANARPADTEARRREEVDLLQRQDVADALKRHYNITVDWRTTPLEKLIDIRLRAAKAADLQARLGVTVDWQRYSWVELEALRRTLLSFEHYRNGDTAAPAAPREPPAPPPGGARATAPAFAPPPASGDDGLVRPTFKERPVARATRPTDPDGVIRPTFTGRAGAVVEARDPDGVIRPTFAVRPRWTAVAADPDGLIAPTFAPTRRFASIGDADDLIDPTRSTEVRSIVPARW